MNASTRSSLAGGAPDRAAPVDRACRDGTTVRVRHPSDVGARRRSAPTRPRRRPQLAQQRALELRRHDLAEHVVVVVDRRHAEVDLARPVGRLPPVGTPHAAGSARPGPTTACRGPAPDRGTSARSMWHITRHQRVCTSSCERVALRISTPRRARLVERHARRTRASHAWRSWTGGRTASRSPRSSACAPACAAGTAACVAILTVVHGVAELVQHGAHPVLARPQRCTARGCRRRGRPTGRRRAGSCRASRTGRRASSRSRDVEPDRAEEPLGEVDDRAVAEVRIEVDARAAGASWKNGSP